MPNEELDSLPVCEECEEPIYDEFLYDVEGTILCDECMKNLYRHDAELYERRR